MNVGLQDTQISESEPIVNGAIQSNGDSCPTKEERQRVAWAAIRQIATAHQKKEFDRRREIHRVIENELAVSGQFYRTTDGRIFFFHRSERILYDTEQRAFRDLLSEVSGLSTTEELFRFSYDRLRSWASRAARQVDIAVLAAYEAGKQVMAVSDGANGVWFYRNGNWSKGDNGDEGYIFQTEPDAVAWTPTFHGNGAGIRWLLSQFNLAGSQAEVQLQRDLLEIALLSHFFRSVLHTRPIITFLGPQGSGKTTCCRLIGRMHLGPNFNVCGLRDDKEDAFVAMVTNRVLATADNADTRVRWLEDALARYATGETFRLRRLYSTNEEVSYRPSATLMLTSRDPHFRRPDVAERLLPFHLCRLEQFVDEESLFSDLYKRRCEIMGDILSLVGQAVDAFATIPAPKLQTRMADFASFGWRVHKYRGSEERWNEVLAYLQRSQTDFASEGDVIIEVLRNVLSSKTIEAITTGDLFALCRAEAEAQSLDFPRTAQAFGKRFWERQGLIELELGVKILENRIGAGKKTVTFKTSLSAQSSLP